MAVRVIVRKVAAATGIFSLANAERDIYLLLATRFTRTLAFGSSMLILVSYFELLGYSDIAIGLFMSMTLVGDVLISLVLTLFADRMGRRKVLILGALLMTMSGIVFATASNYWVLLLAAIVGVISPGGSEIGPFRAVEESTIAYLCPSETRGDIFAWYVVFGTFGTAGSTLACGWVTQTLQDNGWTQIHAFRTVFWAYAVFGLIKATLSMFLSKRCELETPESEVPANAQVADLPDEQQPLLSAPASVPAQPESTSSKKKRPMLSPESRRTVIKLCSLFFLDSLASGMVPMSFVAGFIQRKFGTSEGELGSILSSASVLASIGNIMSASVAKRIGFVRTMVFTHLPSAVCLALFSLPDSKALSIVLLVARSSLASMDQAPRSAFISAVVLPNERTAVLGIVNTVKTSSSSLGPFITGALASGDKFWLAFVVAGCLKIAYDLSLLGLFVGSHAHTGQSAAPTQQDDRDTVAAPAETLSEHVRRPSVGATDTVQRT